MPNTIKHLSYAGITLPLSPSFLENKWLSVVHDQYEHVFGDFWNFDRPNVAVLPTPRLPKPPKFKLDVLSWPTGASSPAWFHTIVETSRWQAISAACAPNGYNTAKPLQFFDGNYDNISNTSAPMMIVAGAPKPLNQLGYPNSDLWVLTLTDMRFYWHFARTNIFQPSSWDNLFSQIADALNIELTIDEISPNYGRPSNKWVLPYQASTSAIFDAAASQVGQRVVVNFDGSVKTVNWRTARQAASDYINTTVNLLLSGGLLTESDIAKSVPRNVRVLFLDNSSDPPPSAPYVVQTQLDSLAIPEYGTATGIPNYTYTIYGDMVFDGLNFFEVGLYAEQAASDWYGWRLMNTDLVYAGIEAWNPTGWEDCIEFTMKLVAHNPALPYNGVDHPYCKTQIRREPWTTDNTSGSISILQISGPPNFRGNNGSGSPSSGGSSGGSGSNNTPCASPIQPVSVDCVNGIQTLTVNRIGTIRNNGQLIVGSCGTDEIKLGPCSTQSPGGYVVPVPFAFCLEVTPVTVATPGGGTAVVNSVQSLSVTYGLAGVSNFDRVGCQTFTPTTGQSGSGNDCCEPNNCPPSECIINRACPNGMSTKFVVTLEDDTTVELNYLCNSSSGDNTQFVSAGGLYRMFYINVEQGGPGWVIQDTRRGQFWFAPDTELVSELCGEAATPPALPGANFFLYQGEGIGPDSPSRVIRADAVYDCQTFTWNCSSGTCFSVSGSGGTYPTEEECEKVCGGGVSPPPIIPPCCENGRVVAGLLTATFSGGTGDHADLNGKSVTLKRYVEGDTLPPWVIVGEYQWWAEETLDMESPTFGPQTVVFYLFCNGENWRFGGSVYPITNCSATAAEKVLDTAVCGPLFSGSATGIVLLGCDYTGSVNVNIIG